MSRKLFLIASILIILCSCAVVPQRLPELYKRNTLGIVSIYIGKSEVFNGSGFVIDRKNGLVITAAHVIRQEKFFKIKFDSGDKVSGFIYFIDYCNDIVILKIDPNSYNCSLFPDFQLECNPSVGEFIFSIGNPGEFNETISFGVLSRNLTYVDYLWASFPLGIYLSDIHIFGGSSGCPVFNFNNKIIGMVVGYNYNYTIIVPAISIEKFMNDKVYAN